MSRIFVGNTNDQDTISLQLLDPTAGHDTAGSKTLVGVAQPVLLRRR